MADLTDDALYALAATVGQQLLGRRLKLATAESCTGGWVAKVVTEVPGSSDWFDAAFVAYSYEAKEAMLGVDRRILERFGAVSEEAVLEMVRGALSRSRANVALAITGIAGPTGGTPDKPVGTVWLAWGFGHHPPEAKVFRFGGDRDAIRRETVRAAFEGLHTLLSRH
ncbi:MAG: CinA family protein [Xanthomonadales bacterium]|nr:CinA family protein [Xanthomonadales bacterium]